MTMIDPEGSPDAVFHDSISIELRLAGERASIGSQGDKKNYAERLSRALAQTVANRLRSQFAGILPDASGAGQESKARSSKGYKKLDVNYSTTELGLGLGVSIKTINFRDPRTKRYTKNYTRADAELRAEATDYHERQPFAVMIGLVFLPDDACSDGSANRAPSSFGQAVQIFRFRSGRKKHTDSTMLFERVFIGLYDVTEASFGAVGFFDVDDAPPRNGRPNRLLSVQQLIDAITETYDARNRPKFAWADGATEAVILPASAAAPDEE